jgi:hypothetical protein
MESHAMLEDDVRAITTAHGRRVGTSSHDAAGRHIIERLGQIGVEGYEGSSFELPYRSDDESFLNIVGRLTGTNPD